MNNQFLATQRHPHFDLRHGTPTPVTEASQLSFVSIDGLPYCRISDVHALDPFFMSLVSAGNQWMFVASNGALTAGRQDPDQALFPYYSADKILDLSSSIGPLTMVQIQDGHRLFNWSPFESKSPFVISRQVYKSVSGSSIIFEETNHTLELKFRYGWQTGHQAGFIRRCVLTNLGQPRHIRLLDGLQNLVPSDLSADFQNRFSVLADAYKRNELRVESSLALYYLNSIPTDRAEPAEGLRTTVAWRLGLEDATLLLSNQQVEDFRTGNSVIQEFETRGRRGSYLTVSEFELDDERAWTLVADVGYDATDVAQLEQRIGSVDVATWLQSDIDENEFRLQQMVAAADGMQCGSDLPSVYRHRSNVTFNIMRGGVPVDNDQLPVDDLLNHLKQVNRRVYSKFEADIRAMAPGIRLRSLNTWAGQQDDPDLLRIIREYMPLCFSRRHGDPTRPWNRFSIQTRDRAGRATLDYQGNWRDLFQNWEALGFSFPQLFPSMLTRFVNASTLDGHNPYRVSKTGVDWEQPEPGSAWSNFGYWGDHQIIYQLKLMEHARRFTPEVLDSMLTERTFTFANVPYRIADYETMLTDVRNTIEFDHAEQGEIEQRVEKLGTDGQLCRRGDHPIRVSLLEKLLLSGMVKFTNLIPQAGLWLNTQRPEWNDANNALVGIGSSVVTACYLRRFFDFLASWLDSQSGSFEIALELAKLLDGAYEVAQDSRLDAAMDDHVRRQFVDRLQGLATQYRRAVYSHGLSESTRTYCCETLLTMLRRFVAVLDVTIQHNRRDDGLFHSYNLVTFQPGTIQISPLEEMLEGQVAVLSSGLLDGEQACDVVGALESSNLYREDQHSFLLYPDRQLPRFMDKNRVPAAVVQQNPLLQKLAAEPAASVFRQDVNGAYRFAGQLANAGDLQSELDRLSQRDSDWEALISEHAQHVVELYASTFGHDRFTGRSGAFFAYEGLGSIYWHMVSKLSLAVQENILWAESKSDNLSASRLTTAYRKIQAGLGVHKSPAVHGAFPTDPYSHTPQAGGARQPGMTGQVKEDILTRLTELGIRIMDGQLEINPGLFQSCERLESPTEFEFIGLDGGQHRLPLEPGQFAFTFCQVPIVLQAGPSDLLTVHRNTGQEQIDGSRLSVSDSQSIFARDGKIHHLHFQSPQFPSE